MTPQQNLSIAHKWFTAFNEHNLDSLLSLYDEDAEHFSPKLKIKKPETNGLVKGKIALHGWWESAFESIPTLHYRVTSLTADADRIFMEYVRTVIDEPDLLIAEVLEVKDGKIVFSRVYHG